jgi:hypothetical protein
MSIKTLISGLAALMLCACAPNKVITLNITDNPNAPEFQRYEKLKSDINFAKHEAQAGDVPAMEVLGLKYINGDGVEKNASEGMAWIEKSAEKGDSSQKLMAGSLFLGDSTGNYAPIRNYEKARFWFEEAASEGDALSLAMLADLYANGLGVAKDDKLASELLQKAKSRGIVIPSGFLYGEKT